MPTSTFRKRGTAAATTALVSGALLLASPFAAIAQETPAEPAPVTETDETATTAGTATAKAVNPGSVEFTYTGTAGNTIVATIQGADGTAIGVEPFTAVLDESGEITAVIEIPTGLAPGDYTLNVQEGADEAEAGSADGTLAEFTVHATPAVSLQLTVPSKVNFTYNHGTPGNHAVATITAVGDTVTLGTAAGVIGEDGTFVGEINPDPALAPGSYTITVQEGATVEELGDDEGESADFIIVETFEQTVETEKQLYTTLETAEGVNWAASGLNHFKGQSYTVEIVAPGGEPTVVEPLEGQEQVIAEDGTATGTVNLYEGDIAIPFPAGKYELRIVTADGIVAETTFTVEDQGVNAPTVATDKAEYTQSESKSGVPFSAEHLPPGATVSIEALDADGNLVAGTTAEIGADGLASGTVIIEDADGNPLAFDIGTYTLRISVDGTTLTETTFDVVADPGAATADEAAAGANSNGGSGNGLIGTGLDQTALVALTAGGLALAGAGVAMLRTRRFATSDLAD